jgi:DNA-binding NarL/FixJ family response regulator
VIPQVFLVRVEDARLQPGDVAAALRSWCGVQTAGVAVSEQAADLVDQMVAQPDLGPLTPHQLRIMTLVAGGVTRRHLAARLGVAEGTVQHHLRGAYRRLGIDTGQLSSKATLCAALMACLRLGLVHVDREGAA